MPPGAARPASTPLARPSAPLPDDVLAARADPANCIDRYVTLGELGKGGMGVVLRAYDTRLHREVAIKMILDPRADGEPVARFEREANAAASLRHGGIVGVHEVGEHAGKPFLVMDLVRGVDLETLLREGRVSPRRSAEIVRDVARALAHAHEQRVIHRDVKPQNILIDEATERPLLTDFGLARSLAAGDRITVTGQILGTPAYMAPEQASGHTSEHGPRSDVYSSGAVLYRALAGHPPFRSSTPVGVIKQVLFEDPAPLRTAARRVHVDLETIAMRCLEKDPERRYASATALADDLDRFLEGEPIAARPAGRVARARRWIRRHRLASALLFAALLALVGAAVAFAVAVRTARASFVADARADAERAWDAFRDAEDAENPAILDPAARARRGDELLALGLEALEAGGRLVALTPDDPETRARAHRTAMRLGRVALDARQWSVAEAAFGRATAAAPDGATLRAAEAALSGVADARRAVVEERAAVVRAAIADAREGRLADADAYADALFAVVALADAETVALLSTALDEVSARMWDAVRAVLHEAATPFDDEARVGATPLDVSAIDAALAEARDAPPGTLRVELHPALAEAAERVVTRRMRRESGGHRLSFWTIASVEQRDRLGPGSITLARLCAEALRRIGIRRGALHALARYVAIEADPVRLAPAAVAVCLLAPDDVHPVVVQALNRHGFTGSLAAAVGRHAGDLARPVDAGAAGNARAAEHRERGLVLQAKGELAAALVEFERALELEPDDVTVLTNLGACLVQKGELARAVEVLARALGQAPSAAGFQNRGAAKHRLGDLDGAHADFSDAIGYDPESAAAWSNRALVRRDAGNLEGALADSDRATALAPRDAKVWIDRARVHEDLGAMDDARTDLGRAIELAPGSILARVRRADLLRRLGRLQDAAADASFAVELDPSATDAWAVRADVRKDARDYDGAIADYDRLLTLDPANAGAWRQRGNCKRYLRLYQPALDDVKEAIRLAGSDALNWEMAALIQLEAGSADRAIGTFARAIELEPSALRWELHATALQRSGRLQEALVSIDRAVTLDPNQPRAWVARGSIRRGAKDPAGAEADFRRALELDPRCADAHEGLGVLLYEGGDLPGALAQMDRAATLDPDSPQILGNRGVLRAQSGDVAGAIADHTRVLQIDPRRAEALSRRGALRLKTGETVEAIADFERFLQLAPNDADAPAIRRKLAELRGG